MILLMISFVSFVLLFISGLYVFLLNRESVLNRKYFFLVTVEACFLFLTFMMRFSRDVQTAYFFNKLGSIWAFIPFFLLTFTVTYTNSTKHKRCKIYQVAVFLLCSFVFVLDLMTNTYSKYLVLDEFGYTYKFEKNTLAVVTISLILFVFITIFIDELLFLYKSNKDKRKEAFFVVLGIIVSILAFVFGSSMIPISDRGIPEIFAVGCMIQTICFFIVMLKTDIFIVSAKNLSEEILATISDGIILFNEYGDLTYSNNAIDKLITRLSKFDNAKSLIENFNLDYYQKLVLDDNFEDIEYEVNSNSNKPIYLSVSKKSIIKSQSDKSIGNVYVVRDITEKNESSIKIKEIAFIDRLTHLYNRVFFDNKLATVLNYNKCPISYVIVNILGLKMINDKYGTHNGDVAIIYISEILKLYVKSYDYVIRLGGDEFLLVIHDSDRDNVIKVISSINNELLKSEFPFECKIATGYEIQQKEASSLYPFYRNAMNMMNKNKILEASSASNEVLRILLKALEVSTEETLVHCERMRLNAQLFADAIKLDQNDRSDIIILALLHDIGKIAIPIEILNKPTSLNNEEWEIMKTHCEKGYRIALSSNGLEKVAEGILGHHENYDGTGYPQGLKGKEIPLISRMMSIIDAFDVMTHRRVYHNPMTFKEAKKELELNKGSQFDPELIDLFINEVVDKLDEDCF